MNLKLQIISLLFSCLFGIYFFIGLEINDSVVAKAKIKFQILSHFLYVFVNTLLYFILLRKINNAIFHPYEILMIIIGYIVGFYLFQYIDKKYHIKEKLQKKKSINN